MAALNGIIKRWKKGSRLEKMLTTYIITFIGLSLCIVIANALWYTKNSNKCKSPTCIQSSAMMLNYMNQSINPCNDFYEFACGKFVRSTIIPVDAQTVNPWESLRENTKYQLLEAFEAPDKVDDPRTYKLVRAFYRSCINESQIERNGYTTIRDIYKYLGGWPALEGEQWNNNSYNWIEVMSKIRKIGYYNNFLINLLVTYDLSNSSKNVIQIYQAQLDLDKKYYLQDWNSPELRAHFKFIKDILVLFDVDKKTAEKEATDILQFSIKLAKIYVDDISNYAQYQNPITIDELQVKYPSIPWLKFVNNFLELKYPIKSDEVLNDMLPSYLENVLKLINDTPSRTLANYIGWRVLRSSIPALTKDVREVETEYFYHFTGTIDKVPRWKYCIDSCINFLGTAAGSLYVRTYFDEESKIMATKIVLHAVKVLKNILNELNWMDDSTKKHALEKAEAMATHVGYPNELLDNNVIDKFHESLTVNDTNYLGSILNATRFLYDNNFGELHKSINRSHWTKHAEAAQSNTEFDPNENSIAILAGMLKGAFFAKDRPMYLNYGTIGTVIGVPITAGFNDQGRQYDAHGNLFNWWSETTESKFEEKVNCINDQYSKYVIPEINMSVNALLTSSINIADNGGVKIAYYAYKEWLKENNEENVLYGLNYNQIQLFWISSAQIWCSKDRLESIRSSAITSEFTPERFRVNGPLSNLKEFSKDFNCPKGSPMNPKDKCIMW